VNPPQNPLAALGLPATWQPVPVAWGLAKVAAQTVDGPRTEHVLVVHSCNGTQGYKFTTDELRAIAEKMLEQCTGLTVAGAMPAPRNGLRAAGGPNGPLAN